MGSATTVVNRVTKLQSLGVTVRQHAPTEDSHTSRPIQDHRSPKKKNKKDNFNLYRVHLIFFRVLWLQSHNLARVQIVCCPFVRGNWMGMKDKKWSMEKTEELQKGDWNGKIFNRE